MAEVCKGEAGSVYFEPSSDDHPRLEKQHSVRQERRECFIDDNEAVYAELQRQLARPTQGQTSGSRRKVCDLRLQDLVARNSQDLSYEPDTSIDFWESSFLD